MCATRMRKISSGGIMLHCRNGYLKPKPIAGVQTAIEARRKMRLARLEI